jgi:sorbitol-specific phosphotransferase system component IIC
LEPGDLVKYVPVYGGINFGVFVGTTKLGYPMRRLKMRFLVGDVVQEIPTGLIFKMEIV